MIDVEFIKMRMEMEDLLDQIKDPLFLRFFDRSSDELIHEKIKVMKMILEGKQISDIPMYYDVLELYPKDTTTRWDY